ncbi:MAG TPA: DUF2637 domain-containing protein [Pseudonocardiaceae bacterium]|jgi:hypothetical protein|nr:DUF2637 domain-containing protein [Pseudonocardiaceae bacterium]
MRKPDLTAIARTVVTVALGGIGASAGFTHTHDWANTHWQHGWLAWADAVVIEGLAIVAGFEVHRDHQAGRKGRAALVPQVVLGLSFVIQMTAQVAQAEPTAAGWLLAAMPALGFLTVVKLIMRRLPARPDQPPTEQTDARHAVNQATAVRTDTTPKVASPAPTTVEPPARPALTTATRLPAPIRSKITAMASQAHEQGRTITVEEIRRTITLPEGMLTQLVAELNANHTPGGQS